MSQKLLAVFDNQDAFGNRTLSWQTGLSNVIMNYNFKFLISNF